YAVYSFYTHVQYAQLTRGTTADLKVTSYFQAVNDRSPFTAHLDGPMNRDVVMRSQHANPLVWSVCGRPRALNLVTEMKLTGPQGLLTGDSVDASPGLDVKLVFKKCR